MEIELTSNAAPVDAQKISQGIVNFNRAIVPDLEEVSEEKKFFVFSRDGQGEVTGGIRALCYWNTLEVELLWVNELHRGQKLGTRMLKQAEDFARTHGYEQSFVKTTSFQARPFYESQGYVTIATIEDMPKGHKAHFCLKKL